MTRTGVLIAAHGSRHDPAVNAGVRSLAASLRASCVADEVRAGFHQGVPHFTEALDSFTVPEVLVVPFFTSAGYYTETAVPSALRASRRADQVVIRYTPPVGTLPELASLVHRRTVATLEKLGLAASDTGVLLIGHGTRRHPESRTATVRLAERLGATGLAAEVRSGFLDDSPAVEAALARLAGSAVVVVPFLIGGAHAAADLPRRLGLTGVVEHEPLSGEVNGRRIVLDVPVGSYPMLGELVVDLVRRELAPGAAGTVALVGAGPGDPGLITVRGLELLRGADVILHDRLIPHELLAEARSDTIVVDVGKAASGRGPSQAEINALLVGHASRGRSVVRLKGGDPFVFGRGSEELEACRLAGIPCTVVPGVTSAIAVPAAAGIPVTARGEARSFAVVTGQVEQEGPPADLDRLAMALNGIDTVVVLMGRASLAELASGLIAAGRDPDTPAACIQQGTTPLQRVVTGTLATIADEVEHERLRAPLVTVIGAVAARAAPAEAAC